MASNPIGIDVVGVDHGSNGRHCEQHEICGHFVAKNDKLYCKWAIQKFDSDEPESCVQVFKLASDGHIGCHIGYLPWRLVKGSRDKATREKDGGKSFDGTWLNVVNDLRLSDNTAERSRSHRNYGILHCHVSNEEWLVGKNPFNQFIIFPESEKNKEFVLLSARKTGAKKANGDDDDDDETTDDDSV
jgi:hypothetical protein